MHNLEQSNFTILQIESYCFRFTSFLLKKFSGTAKSTAIIPIS